MVTPPPVESGPLDPAVRRVVIAVMVGAFLAILDTTVVNVAINTLGRDLHSSLPTTQWVITAYLLGLAAVIPLSGWLARRVGPKRLYVFALVLFTVSSGLCGAAGSAHWLIAFRALQGVAGGVSMPVGQMIVGRAAGPGRMGRAIGAVSAAAIVAPAIGPIIGGLIVTNFSWRWIFYVNLPIGAVAVLLSLRFIPATTTSEPAGPIDWLGFVLLGSGLPAFVYGLAAVGQGADPAAPGTLLPLVGGILLIGLFVRHAFRAERPLLDLRLLRNPVFAYACLVSFALSGGLFGPYILMPLFFQTVHGATPLVAGLLFAAQGVGAQTGVTIARRVTDRVGGGLLALFGGLLFGVATIPFAFFDASTPYWAIVAALLFRGIGTGSSNTPATAAALAAVRREELADAAPQLNVVSRVGASIATAVFAVVLANQLHTRLGHAAPGHARQAMAVAYQHTYWWVLGLNVLTLPPAFLLARSERSRRRARLSTPEPAPA
jgi:EmrB/QacA subfamily drug resistance transporter